MFAVAESKPILLMLMQKTAACTTPSERDFATVWGDTYYLFVGHEMC